MRNARISALALAAASFGVLSLPAVAPADDAPPAETPADPAKAERAKWGEHMGDLPFVVGFEKGMKEVEFTGKPPMLFFTTTWCHWCKQLADESFKNPDVVKAAAYFTPIIVDGDVEKDVCTKYGASGWPHTVFCDAKGEQVGQAIGGYKPTPEFLKLVQDAAKKIKPGKPSKDFATLTAAKAEFDAAQAKKQVAATLAAVAKIEKVNHLGAVLDAASAAKKQLLEDGQKRLDAAKTAAQGDGKDAALKELRKLAADYKGTDVGTEAGKLVKDMEPPAPK